jgi:hypothetical protein
LLAGTGHLALSLAVALLSDAKFLHNSMAVAERRHSIVLTVLMTLNTAMVATLGQALASDVGSCGWSTPLLSVVRVAIEAHS